jgi:glycosyltransferase involved in cell wall biosynthesis
MISVVTPNLNEEAHMPQFLESLQAQTWRDFELILVDGGSTDLSPIMVMNMPHSFPVHVHVDETRNIGHIRNVGSRLAKGDILLHTNSDCYLPPRLIAELTLMYAHHPDLISVAGRTRPLQASTFCTLSYVAYDVLRWFFSKLGKYRPGGSFCSIRTKQFWELLGFPEVGINEDGHLGKDLQEHRMKCKFAMNLWVGHSPAKRWESSGLQGFSHYTYVFGNFLPFKVFQNLEEHAAQRFQQKEI